MARRGLSAFAEKILHKPAAFGFEDAGCDVDAVIELFAGAKLEMRLDGAETQVVGTENESRNAGIYKCSGAHRARFDCGIDGGSDEPIIVYSCAGKPESDDLGVGGRVAVDDRAVGCGGEFAAVGIDDDRADGHFADLGGGSGLLDCTVHPMFVSLHKKLCGHSGFA